MAQDQDGQTITGSGASPCLRLSVGGWVPDERTERRGRLVAQREIVRHCSRERNEVHGTMQAHLVPKCPYADLFNCRGRALAQAAGASRRQAGHCRPPQIGEIARPALVLAQQLALKAGGSAVLLAAVRLTPQREELAKQRESHGPCLKDESQKTEIRLVDLIRK